MMKIESNRDGESRVWQVGITVNVVNVVNVVNMK